jgi:hypothetical protein
VLHLKIILEHDSWLQVEKLIFVHPLPEEEVCSHCQTKQMEEDIKKEE